MNRWFEFRRSVIPWIGRSLVSSGSRLGQTTCVLSIVWRLGQALGQKRETEHVHTCVLRHTKGGYPLNKNLINQTIDNITLTKPNFDLFSTRPNLSRNRRPGK
jgi:hypothetical protein